MIQNFYCWKYYNHYDVCISTYKTFCGRHLVRRHTLINNIIISDALAVFKFVFPQAFCWEYEISSNIKIQGTVELGYTYPSKLTSLKLTIFETDEKF